jgi:hypothetical protein
MSCWRSGARDGIDVVPVRVDRGALVPLPLKDGLVAFPRASSAREAVDAGAATPPALGPRGCTHWWRPCGASPAPGDSPHGSRLAPTSAAIRDGLPRSLQRRRPPTRSFPLATTCCFRSTARGSTTSAPYSMPQGGRELRASRFSATCCRSPSRSGSPRGHAAGSADGWRRCCRDWMAW